MKLHQVSLCCVLAVSVCIISCDIATKKTYDLRIRYAKPSTERYSLDIHSNDTLFTRDTTAPVSSHLNAFLACSTRVLDPLIFNVVAQDVAISGTFADSLLCKDILGTLATLSYTYDVNIGEIKVLDTAMLGLPMSPQGDFFRALGHALPALPQSALGLHESYDRESFGPLSTRCGDVTARVYQRATLDSVNSWGQQVHAYISYQFRYSLDDYANLDSSLVAGMPSVGMGQGSVIVDCTRHRLIAVNGTFCARGDGTSLPRISRNEVIALKLLDSNSRSTKP